MSDQLEALRHRIDDLTDPDGAFAVVCPHSGERPAPVGGASFPSTEAAEEAALLVCEYRQLLREVDPHLENRSIVAAEETAVPLALDGASSDGASPDGASPDGGRVSSSVTLSGDGESEWLRMDDAPVVNVREDGRPLSDDAVERQLRAKL